MIPDGKDRVEHRLAPESPVLKWPQAIPVTCGLQGPVDQAAYSFK